jgi:hypothetical protein
MPLSESDTRAKLIDPALHSCLRRMAERMRGATRPRVTLTMLRRTEIPIPPISEQRRISFVLAELAFAASRTEVSAMPQLTVIKALPSALLRQAFSGAL